MIIASNDWPISFFRTILSIFIFTLLTLANLIISSSALEELDVRRIEMRRCVKELYVAYLCVGEQKASPGIVISLGRWFPEDSIHS